MGGMKESIAELPEPAAIEIERRMDELTPRVLPAEWRQVMDAANARAFTSRDGLKVISEVERVDGEHWLHVSFSRRDKSTPSWHDTKRVKLLFVGRERKAIQVLPPDAEYVNIAEVLHLFAPLDRDPLPDFRQAGGGI